MPAKLVAALDKRAAKIRADLEDARRLREEAEALLTEYQKKRGEAEAEAEAIVSRRGARRKRWPRRRAAASRIMSPAAPRRWRLRIAQAETQAVAEVRAAPSMSPRPPPAASSPRRRRAAKGDALIERAIETVRKSLN